MHPPQRKITNGDAAASTDNGSPPPECGKTVLLVEDQPEVREVVEMFLDGLGYRSVTVPDGVAAREVLQSDQAVDLLLTDVVMPKGMSGLELATEARRIREGLRVVVVSGYPRDTILDAARLGGAVFLGKPFRQAELGAAIAAAFAGRD